MLRQEMHETISPRLIPSRFRLFDRTRGSDTVFSTARCYGQVNSPRCVAFEVKSVELSAVLVSRSQVENQIGWLGPP